MRTREIEQATIYAKSLKLVRGWKKLAPFKVPYQVHHHIEW